MNYQRWKKISVTEGGETEDGEGNLRAAQGFQCSIKLGNGSTYKYSRDLVSLINKLSMA